MGGDCHMNAVLKCRSEDELSSWCPLELLGLIHSMRIFR